MGTSLLDEDRLLLETAKVAAQEAGRLLVSRFGHRTAVQRKVDSSIVTEVDDEVERFVMDFINKRHPTHGFVGEEGSRTTAHSEFTWVLDPIDGTKNFYRGVPLFSVEIALLKSGIPHIGVSNLPVMQDLTWAVAGKGAFSSQGPLAVSEVDRVSDSYISFGNIKHFERSKKIVPLLGLANQSFQARGIGDSWSLHLLAQGKIDAFLDAKTAFWDVAAASVIVQEAGGVVTDFEGRPIGERSVSIVAANRNLHPIVLEFLQRPSHTEAP